MCVGAQDRRFFVIMDVTSHESEPYFPSKVDSPFGDSPDDGEIRREGEKCVGERSI
jgi:hypothetical protein